MEAAGVTAAAGDCKLKANRNPQLCSHTGIGIGTRSLRVALRTTRATPATYLHHISISPRRARAGKGGFGGESEPECRHERIGALDFGRRGGVLELHTTPDFVMKHHFSQLIWIMHFLTVPSS